MEFVALLSSGKGTWSQVAGLVNRGEWEKIFLICDDSIISKVKHFDFSKKAEIISVDFSKPIKEIIEELRRKLKNKFSGMEIALSIASGDGKEHMALISALLGIPVGIKFVALTREGILEF
ncbi:MAG: hypothetical protein NZ889_00035 [Candidatus Pacearchaeota archaeon]|nr:hypothetical protein [Candidatus Pacearchaeota archaeon]